MNYIDKIIQESISLNSINKNMKKTQEIIEKNIQSFIGKVDSNSYPIDVSNFIEGKFISDYGDRDYKLYIPRKKSNKPLSLLVMLHGCTQSPDDFSIGTEMNKLAEEENMFVLYPKQTSLSNQNKCWSWFKVEKENIGESKILLEMTKSIISKYKITKKNVYVAGMSAGGAMAVILATDHPEVYKAAGIHSGLPYKASNSINSALYVMKNGRRESSSKVIKTPMIVFHGDNDKTVNIKNSEQIIDDIVLSQKKKPYMKILKNSKYTRVKYRDENNLLAEYWIIHNEGHSWSGGNSLGSYTSDTGPNASKEMMKFFLSRS